MLELCNTDFVNLCSVLYKSQVTCSLSFPVLRSIICRMMSFSTYIMLTAAQAQYQGVIHRKKCSTAPVWLHINCIYRSAYRSCYVLILSHLLYVDLDFVSLPLSIFCCRKSSFDAVRLWRLLWQRRVAVEFIFAVSTIVASQDTSYALNSTLFAISKYSFKCLTWPPREKRKKSLLVKNEHERNQVACRQYSLKMVRP